MNITVIGSGYVGTTTAAIFANCDHHNVTVIDIDEEKVKKVNSGKSPFFEAGVAELIKQGVSNKTLRATTSYKEGISDAEIVFSCVGTPDKLDGSSNLDYVFAAAKSAAKFMNDDTIFVQKSTVPVGTGEQVSKLIANSTDKRIDYVSNPEFLREGTAVYDTLMFDRVVAGGSNRDAVERVLEIYLSIESNRQKINQVSGLDISERELAAHKGQYVPASLPSAELTKLSANAFLALKISFANSIAKLADKTGADITEVMDAVGSDKRIGRAFLYAGRGYGGGCFPKDVSGLVMSAKEYGVDFEILDSSTKVNESMPSYIIDKLSKEIGTVKDKKFAVLGLSFKENTSDVRRSPAIEIANKLRKKEAKVTAYDPEASDEAKKYLSKSIDLKKNVKETVAGVDAVIIATPWNEFKNMNLATIKRQMSGDVLVDAMNVFDKEDARKAGFKYIGVGR